MDRLLIIADDFTGALDTGIQFCKKGVKSKVVTEYNYDFNNLDPSISLLVINTDSRPLPPAEAYTRVFNVTKKAVAAGFKNFYKKTDSGLRGNIGIELKAIIDGTGSRFLNFIPALPSLNRITKNGIALIDGVPVKESVFGNDPYEPVKYSDIAEIIHSQCNLNIKKIKQNDYDSVEWGEQEQAVYLFDAEDSTDFTKIAKKMKSGDAFHLCAGCAGFASSYDFLLDFEKGTLPDIPKTDGLLVLCGSVNQITVEQLDYAENSGFQRGNLKSFQKLNKNYLTSTEGQNFLNNLHKIMQDNDKYILDTLDVPGEETVADYMTSHNMTLDECRVQISNTLGKIALDMIKRGLNVTFSLTGGDTLMGLMRAAACTELTPLAEIGKGAVLSLMKWKDQNVLVISKSGGFGEKSIFPLMYESLNITK